jgi:hypothetical protein
MPICERDPWRFQFFEGVACPQNVCVPTDDIDVYEWYSQHNWVYEKLRIAKSQGLTCGMAGQTPQHFPVFAKPNVNLRGMGLDSRIIRTQTEFEALPAGHMWMQLLDGEHISTDCAVVRGKVKWMCHAHGFPWRDGMFTHWVIETTQRVELNHYISSWIIRNLPDYTGMLNIETISGKIIEAHLRFADQWCDLYSKPWLTALVDLYAKGEWHLDDSINREGYSVPLFARHGTVPPHPPAHIQQQVRTMPGISSLQIPYVESKPEEAHPMPPGGFRLAIINCWDLNAGKAAREILATAFQNVEIMLPE